MSEITFTRAEKDAIVDKIKTYFTDKLDQDIGQFDAEFLLDFFSEEIGTFFYNRGLYDAEKAISEKLSDISDVLLDLERPVSFTNR